ncbi:hypothetical protein [Streptomyces sp. KR55]|uniref:hypothetical protein n=1 Tax=Streptomyces sp. KR55 TaxID=3457425 RepID=UPI003FD2CCC2
MSSAWTCDGCGVPNIDRASCEACGTSSPTATAADLARTALQDAAAARAVRSRKPLADVDIQVLLI